MADSYHGRGRCQLFGAPDVLELVCGDARVMCGAAEAVYDPHRHEHYSQHACKNQRGLNQDRSL